MIELKNINIIVFTPEEMKCISQGKTNLSFNIFIQKIQHFDYAFFQLPNKQLKIIKERENIHLDETVKRIFVKNTEG